MRIRGRVNFSSLIPIQLLVDQIPSPPPHPSLLKVVALYSYEAQGSQEMSIEEGAIVTIITKEDDVWWCGQLLDGTTGMFPANYVTPYQT